VGEVPYVAHLENCIGCKLCAMRCPDFAIDVEVK
jgi:2-oxoglutarate ferredoxin oxidoreductase subunit delta